MDNLQGPVTLVLPQPDLHSHSIQDFCQFTSSFSRDRTLKNQDKNNEIEQNVADDLKDQNQELTDSHKPILAENDSRVIQKNLLQEKNMTSLARGPSEENSRENQENVDPRRVEEFGFRRVSMQNIDSNGVFENSRQLRRVSQSHQTTSHQMLRLRKIISKPMIQDVVQISNEIITFGKLIPGQISQENIQLTNKTLYNIQISVEVELLVPEFRELEECVYSVRRHMDEISTNQYSLILPASSTSGLIVAIKVPFIKFTGEIKGILRVTAQGFSDRILADLVCFSSIPRIICPSELYHSHIKCGIVNLAIKRGKKQETRIPFKNESDLPLVLAFGFFSAKNGNEERKHFCKISPNVAKLPPKGMGVLTLSILTSEINRKGKYESSEREKIQEILVCRIVESAIFYSFALSIELY